MRRYFYILVTILLLSSFLLSACSSPTPTTTSTTTTTTPATMTTTAVTTTAVTTTAVTSPPVELRLWSGWASDKWTTKPYMWWFLDKYKDKLATANITFKYIGGPEVFPTTEGMSAMKKGLFDAAFTTTAYFTGDLPEGDALKLSKLMPWEERTSGFYDFFNKINQEKINAYYSWRLPHDGYFSLWLNEERTTPDLTGLKIRTSPVYTPIVKALGGTPLSSNMDELYTMLERKMVDGYGAPAIGISDRKWELVTKYRWGPYFYTSPSGMWYNLDKWKSLTDQQRNVLNEVAIAAEIDSAPMWAGDLKTDWAINEKAGVKTIKFSAEDEKKFLDLAYEEGWKAVLTAAPNMAPARAMMEKK